jgi:proteasome lid subunit RPN8/RPN11
MIRIESEPWAAMVAHARASYPNECCGAMLGATDGDTKLVREAIALQNAFEGAQAARERQMDLIGIYHSHPDCDAYFSATDLQNSCPWYSFVVLSIQKGEFHHANCFLPNFDQTEAPKEELIY